MSPLEWLFGLEQFGIKFGLDNIRTLVAALGHPERSFRSLHVAGTNGKGSVTAMVDTALRAAGHRSGRYTSPHLLDLTERFVVDGRPVAGEALVGAVSRVRTEIDSLLKSGALDVHPTFFEATTAVAFELFREAGVDVVVCEVGLGGRLDATNVLDPDVTAITSIGFDHTQFLGTTLAQIAAEKAGIIKRGVPVVVGSMPPQAFDEIRRTALDRGAPLIDASDPAILAEYGNPRIALPGEHQIKNAAVAIRLLEAASRRGIAISRPAIVDGLSQVRWPGRLDLRRLPDGRGILLDAAHNPDGARALAAFLASNFTDKPPLLFAVMRDKNVTDMLEALTPHVRSLILTKASTARSAEPAWLAEHARMACPGLPLVVEPDLTRALAAAWRAAPFIVVAGSIFLLGDVLKELGCPWYAQS